MSNTTKLSLPQIQAAQAQKHITHNEALQTLDIVVQAGVMDRDIADPPGAPGEGDSYIIAAAPTGAWSGKQHQLAVWQNGVWAFFQPNEGWLVWIEDENKLLAWDGSAWVEVTGAGGSETASKFGINTTADLTNRLSAKTDAVLFSHDDITPGTGDIRAKLNKSLPAKTASFLFQDNFSGRAEIGLAGDDDFHFKVSPDGASWNEALVIDKDSGGLKSVSSINGGPLAGMRNKVVNGRFDIWQRGTSFSANGYTADRFYCGNIDGGGGAATISRQDFTLGQTDVPGEPEFYYQHDQTTASTAQALIGQKIEGVRSFAGQTLTLSFWARVTSGTLSLIPYWTQYFGSGGSANVNVTDTSEALTTSWQKFSVTRDIPSVTGKTIGAGNYLSLELLFPASSVFTAQIANFQIEKGATATEHEQRFYGHELCLCQRYFTQVSGVILVAVSNVIGTYPSWLFPTSMRASPTMTYSYSGGSGATYVVSSEGFYQSGNHSIDSGFSLKADAEL